MQRFTFNPSVFFFDLAGSKTPASNAKDTFEEFCPVRRDGSGDLLVVGCGNSAFSAELHAAGYQQITSIDISATAIRKMQKHFERPGLTWQLGFLKGCNKKRWIGLDVFFVFNFV